jgi:hypothetical protein
MYSWCLLLGRSCYVLRWHRSSRLLVVIVGPGSHLSSQCLCDSNVWQRMAESVGSSSERVTETMQLLSVPHSILRTIAHLQPYRCLTPLSHAPSSGATALVVSAADAIAVRYALCLYRSSLTRVFSLFTRATRLEESFCCCWSTARVHNFSSMTQASQRGTRPSDQRKRRTRRREVTHLFKFACSRAHWLSPKARVPILLEPTALWARAAD